jgi:hypothetical protein
MASGTTVNSLGIAARRHVLALLALSPDGRARNLSGRLGRRRYGRQSGVRREVMLCDGFRCAQPILRG